MAGSILDSFMSTLGPQVVGPWATRLGASPDAVQRGLQSGSAAMLAGVAAKADQPGFMSQIFGLINNPAVTSSSLPNLASSISSGAPGGLADLGSKFVSTIFGSNMTGVTDAVARTSGCLESARNHPAKSRCNHLHRLRTKRCQAIPYLAVTRKAILRFCARPSSVELSPTGWSSP